ncbi:GNAT family N-acetyltransferase [Sulfurovum sp. NBC37-1]|uniref:GNAT family N-acetyltransferase n=1 Tax=Sulfurovum sp. (strain NBC37-1) TaxID=387093 RepID=UPI00015876D7|nr:GNAT family N-acetyltransferase [Sulfurovum sp. NBC37-1]BAF71895.1 acetyltransferase [Sulfurovum sp. NBC37-1]
MHFRKAHSNDVKSIVTLVNRAYRGEEGWTTETELVSGNRTNEEEVFGYLNDEDAYLFVLENESIAAVICVEKRVEKAYIGFFAVDPALQGYGVGKTMLQEAETYAHESLEVDHFVMAVLAERKELIAFYIRRGYVRIDRVMKYPVHLNVDMPKRDGLCAVYLEKYYKE